MREQICAKMVEVVAMGRQLQTEEGLSEAELENLLEEELAEKLQDTCPDGSDTDTE